MAGDLRDGLLSPDFHILIDSLGLRHLRHSLEAHVVMKLTRTCSTLIAHPIRSSVRASPVQNKIAGFPSHRTKTRVVSAPAATSPVATATYSIEMANLFLISFSPIAKVGTDQSFSFPEFPQFYTAHLTPVQSPRPYPLNADHPHVRRWSRVYSDGIPGRPGPQAAVPARLPRFCACPSLHQTSCGYLL